MDAQKELASAGITLRHVSDVAAATLEGIREVFVLRQEGGIVDRGGELITLCTRDDVRTALSLLGSSTFDPDLNDAGRQVLAAAHQLLEQRVGRVVITSADRIVQEIDDWRGAGTLVFDPAFMQKRMLQEDEWSVVRMVMDDLISTGHFRSRSDEIDLLRRHYVLDVKGLLGGVSLLDWGEGNEEFARLWTGHPGNGLGCQIGAYAVEEWRKSDSKALYALTKTPNIPGRQSLFEKIGFTHLGRISTLKHQSNLPLQITNYNVEGRDPEVYQQVK